MRHYRLIDYLTQGYAAFVGAIIVLCHNEHLANWPAFVLTHVAILVAVHLIIRAGSRAPNTVLGLLRGFYPVLLYTFFYVETHSLDSLFVPQPMDGVFIAFDYGLFGCHPSREFMLRLPYLPVSELMYFAYFTYYIMVPGVGLALYARDRRRFFEYITVISFVFYACYATYIFFPVLGPHTLEPMASTDAMTLGPRVVPRHLASGIFFRTMRFVYETFEPTGGAAFPSSHVAVALATAYYTWRYVRKVRWVHLVDVLLLATSTVYCGYHYVADVFAGALTAAVLLPLAVHMYPRFELPEGADTAATPSADGDPASQDVPVTPAP